MKLLITGARGLVGKAVVTHCEAAGETLAAFDHHALDVSDEAAVNAAFDAVVPDAVINCAAWTDVDGCESNREHAMRANARGPELLALACRRVKAALVTISTDYVFDGVKDGFYTQRDQPNPQSVYAISKLEGERRAQAAWARTIVVRSGYIFGVGGKNFLSTVVERGRRGETVAAIGDAFGTPTFARDLAGRLYDLAQFDLPGTYHVVNGGDGASFLDFARYAFEQEGLDVGLVRSITFDSLNRPAPRPRNSRLRCLLSPAVGLEPLPFWKEAVQQFIMAQTAVA